MTDDAKSTRKRKPKLSSPNGARLAVNGGVLPPGDVAIAQELLAAHGFDVGGEEEYGLITAGQVRAFQAAHGLKVDGIVGLQTWRKLREKPSPAESEPLPVEDEEVDSL